MGKKFSGITKSTTELPPWILGGNPSQDPELDKFITFPTSLLTSFINDLIAARPASITLTGLSGSIITHAAIAGRGIAFLLFDGFPRNTNFEKGNNNDIESAVLILTDDYELKEEETLTIVFA